VLVIWERSPSTQKMLMAGPLGGEVRDLGVPTINTKSVDGGPPDPCRGGEEGKVRDLKGVL
jgi:hypothetical protein